MFACEIAGHSLKAPRHNAALSMVIHEHKTFLFGDNLSSSNRGAIKASARRAGIKAGLSRAFASPTHPRPAYPAQTTHAQPLPPHNHHNDCDHYQEDVLQPCAGEYSICFAAMRRHLRWPTEIDHHGQPTQIHRWHLRDVPHQGQEHARPDAPCKGPPLAGDPRKHSQEIVRVQLGRSQTQYP